MIDGKILKFGYGDIAVANKVFAMALTPFKPPVEVGTDCYDLFSLGVIEPIGETIYIQFETFFDFHDLKDKLDNLHTHKVFVFKGYTFDFTNYNAKSVEVVENVRKAILRAYLQCAAC